MNDSCLISIIGPVYNVEHYLNECVVSIVKQTYENLEIILVDDGSTDESGKICDTWGEKDTRIQVIHKNNGGLSEARNTGLKVANGEYIAFIDSDDLIEESFIEKLYSLIENNDAQVSCCAYQTFQDGMGHTLEGKQRDDIRILQGSALVEAIYSGKYSEIAFVAWNKLYSVELFRKNNIAYPEGRVHEDTFTTYRLLYYSQTVAICDEKLYWYRVRPGSITNTKIGIKRCEDGVEADYSNICFFNENNEKKLAKLALNAFYRSTIKTYKLTTSSPKDKETLACMKILMNKYKCAWNENHNKYYFGFVKTIIYRLFMVFPNFISQLF